MRERQKQRDRNRGREKETETEAERGGWREREGERDRERGRDRETYKVRGQEIKVVRGVAKGRDRRGKMTADICTPIRQR